MNIVEVSALSFSYGSGRRILDDITFSVGAGESVALAGLSGCGKTTLCHCLCGVIPHAVGGALSGSVTVDGQTVADLPLCQAAGHIGLVFQNPDDMLICATVEDELAFGPENLCMPPEEIRRRVDETLAEFGLETLRQADPARLSGGQKKLVTIASVLVMGPRVVVLDEPMTGLDEESRGIVRAAIDRMKGAGCTVIAAEHDLTLAGYADRIFYLREGRLYDQP